MIGWSIFVGPSVRDKDPDELRRNIERIPLKERRDAWRMAIYNEFPEKELAESGRRVQNGIRVFEEEFGKHPYCAGDTYSLADINAFCMAYALPMMQPEFVNAEKTPNLVAWLKRIYDRPAIEETFKLGRTPMAERAMEVRKMLDGEQVDA